MIPVRKISELDFQFFQCNFLLLHSKKDLTYYNDVCFLVSVLSKAFLPVSITYTTIYIRKNPLSYSSKISYSESCYH